MDRDRKKAELTNVQSSSTKTDSASWAGQAIAHATGDPTVIVIGDLSRAKTDGTLSEAEYRDKKKFLFEKQAYEVAKLENDLHTQEVEAFNEAVQQFENKKENVCNEMTVDFKERLKEAKTQEEKERIMNDYAGNMGRLNDALEKQKQSHLAELRQKMLDRRRKTRKELHNSHISEAQGRNSCRFTL